MDRMMQTWGCGAARLIRVLLLAAVAVTGANDAVSQNLDSLRIYRNEIQVVSENDNYLFNMNDGYYTNGLILSYSFINYDSKLTNRVRPGLTKVITRFETGQLIFNPHDYLSYYLDNVDRPFAGYLYGKAQQSRFLINENIIQYGLTLGIIGPSSMAENVQTSYHHFLKIHHLEGWNTQLNNSPCINFNFDYVLHLIAKSPRRVADLAAVGKLNVGTSFDNFSAGLIARLGKFERNDRSVTWDSRLDKAKRLYEKKSELYFYFQPQMTYQVYNATLQGGMFLDNKGPVTASPTPWVFEARFGFRYAKNHISMGASFVHETREARSMMANDDYGSLLLSYRFN